MDSGDCTIVATQPRQLHYSNNLSKKNKNNNSFHLQDVVLGKIYFLNISKLQIKHMELSLLKRETAGMHAFLPTLI